MNCKVAPVKTIELSQQNTSKKKKKEKKKRKKLVKVSVPLLSSSLSNLYHQFREDLLEVLLILYHLFEWGILERVFCIKASCCNIPFALS